MLCNVVVLCLRHCSQFKVKEPWKKKLRRQSQSVTHWRRSWKTVRHEINDLHTVFTKPATEILSLIHSTN